MEIVKKVQLPPLRRGARFPTLGALHGLSLVVAMMDAQACRKRAEGCLRSAESNAAGREQWRWLANTWAAIAEQRVDAERHHPAFAPSRKTAAVDIADILRGRLELD